MSVCLCLLTSLELWLCPRRRSHCLTHIVKGHSGAHTIQQGGRHNQLWQSYLLFPFYPMCVHQPVCLSVSVCASGCMTCRHSSLTRSVWSTCAKWHSKCVLVRTFFTWCKGSDSQLMLKLLCWISCSVAINFFLTLIHLLFLPSLHPFPLRDFDYLFEIPQSAGQDHKTEWHDITFWVAWRHLLSGMTSQMCGDHAHWGISITHLKYLNTVEPHMGLTFTGHCFEVVLFLKSSALYCYGWSDGTEKWWS